MVAVRGRPDILLRCDVWLMVGRRSSSAPVGTLIPAAAILNSTSRTALPRDQACRRANFRPAAGMIPDCLSEPPIAIAGTPELPRGQGLGRSRGSAFRNSARGGAIRQATEEPRP